MWNDNPPIGRSNSIRQTQHGFNVLFPQFSIKIILHMWDNKYMNYEQWHDGKDGTKKKEMKFCLVNKMFS